MADLIFLPPGVYMAIAHGGRQGACVIHMPASASVFVSLLDEGDIDLHEACSLALRLLSHCKACS
jgi:TctA family transporter